MFTTSFWKTCHLWLSLSSLQSRCHLLPKVGDGKSQSLVEALDIRCYRSAASPNCTSMARDLHCCCADNHWNARWTQGSTMRPHWLRRLWAWTMPRFFGGVYFKGQLARGLPLQNKYVQLKMEMPTCSTNKVLIYPLQKSQVEVKRRISTKKNATQFNQLRHAVLDFSLPCQPCYSHKRPVDGCLSWKTKSQNVTEDHQPHQGFEDLVHHNPRQPNTW